MDSDSACPRKTSSLAVFFSICVQKILTLHVAHCTQGKFRYAFFSGFQKTSMKAGNKQEIKSPEWKPKWWMLHVQPTSYFCYFLVGDISSYGITADYWE